MSHLISSSAFANVISRESNVKGASFTVKSIATGKDYTYKIARSEYNGKWYTHVKVETEYLNFKRLGTYYKGRITNKRQLVDTPSAKAIAFVLDAVENGKTDWLDTKMETMHLGKCLCCGRTLTDAVSIETGLGPICGGR